MNEIIIIIKDKIIEYYNLLVNANKERNKYNKNIKTENELYNDFNNRCESYKEVITCLKKLLSEIEKINLRKKEEKEVIKPIPLLEMIMYHDIFFDDELSN